MRGESRKKDTTGRGKKGKGWRKEMQGGKSLESNKMQGLTMCLKQERLKGPQEDFPAPESWPKEDLLLVLAKGRPATRGWWLGPQTSKYYHLLSLPLNG